MKIIDKITLIIYSCLMLIVSIIACLLIFGWFDMNIAMNFLRSSLQGDLSSKIILGVSIVFILLSVKCIFFGSSSKQTDNGQGVLLENDNGKLMISKSTLENLVNSVAIGFESTQDVTTRVELDEENNVNVYVYLVVSPNAVIKELSSDMQKQIKAKIKSATDLEVKEVNIKVKDVAQENVDES